MNKKSQQQLVRRSWVQVQYTHRAFRFKIKDVMRLVRYVMRLVKLTSPLPPGEILDQTRSPWRGLRRDDHHGKLQYSPDAAAEYVPAG
jgi:hypothetical protein